MYKFSIQINDYKSKAEKDSRTNELFQLCGVLGLQYDVYGVHEDIDILLPNSDKETMLILNILHSYCRIRNLDVRFG